jgi:hypothetical protein
MVRASHAVKHAVVSCVKMLKAEDMIRQRSRKYVAVANLVALQKRASLCHLFALAVSMVYHAWIFLFVTARIVTMSTVKEKLQMVLQRRKEELQRE